LSKHQNPSSAALVIVEAIRRSIFAKEPVGPDTDQRIVALFRKIAEGYCAGDPRDRAYHNLDHLAHTLAHLYAAIREEDGVDETSAVLALLFHDIVYTVGASNNESMSSRVLLMDAASLLPESISVDAAIQAAETIRETANHGHHEPFDVENFFTITDMGVLDCDLAILGEGVDLYEAYRRKIRTEYRNVPVADYVAGRLAFLKKLQSGVFLTDYFKREYEESAQKNIEREISELTNPVHWTRGDATKTYCGLTNDSEGPPTTPHRALVTCLACLEAESP
jgi:predicted metal-dependent HD superfamily phosphohydrolase